jgi:hypothetical protein
MRWKVLRSWRKDDGRSWSRAVEDNVVPLYGGDAFAMTLTLKLVRVFRSQLFKINWECTFYHGSKAFYRWHVRNFWFCDSYSAATLPTYFMNRRRISLKGCDLITLICLVHHRTTQCCLLSWIVDSSWLGPTPRPNPK